MNASNCEQLNAYLGKWLTDSEHAEFVAHLAVCPPCRHAVTEQERLDQLLVEATARRQPAPEGLIDRIEGQLRRVRYRRRLAWAAGLSVAAMVVVSFAVWMLQPAPAPHGPPTPPMMEGPSAPPLMRSEPPARVRVTFPQTPEVIAVPRPSDNPAVTIIWVYPAVPVARQSDDKPSHTPQPIERSGT
jgi:hypothetical protein